MLTWTIKEEKYTQAKVGKCGEITMFSIFYDGMTSKSQKEKYKLTCSLPMIKSNLKHYMTEDEAIKKAEFIFEYWKEKAGLTEKEIAK